MAASKPLGQDDYSDIVKLLKQKNETGENLNSKYDEFLRNLSNPDAEAGFVIQILEGLEQCISLLGKDYQALVNIIMNLNWLDKGPELTSVYQAYILNLVSAHMSYLKPCLKMLIKKFVPVPKKLHGVEDPETARQKTDQDVSHVHALLKSLSQIVPMTSVLMVQILEDQFPYLNRGVSAFEFYTRGVLTVSTYMPALRMDILEMVIKHMLKLDVRSSRLDINTVICANEEESSKIVEDSMFHMDESLDTKRATSKQDSVSEDKFAEALPLAAALDTMMSLTFQFIRDLCYHNGKLDWEVTKRLYRELLSIFEKFIFPTHASCHVQFLMFYICSFKELLAEGFIDYLWKKVTDPTEQSVYRQTAACYIGSFLTRAQYLSINTAKEVLQLMMKWVHSYLEQTCDQRLNADLVHHGPFYSVCQSIFYIFCFKHNDLLQIRKGQKWAESLNIQRVITSKLNPLRLCMPIIVKTFASATRMHQLAFCDTIIERNNRYSLPVTSNSSYPVESSNQKQLESYFPFDPYLLPRSCSHIIPLYKEFRGSLPDEEEVVDDGEEDDFLPDEDDLREPDESTSMSLGKSPVDLLKYDISPGFKPGKGSAPDS